jgi:rhodanese-related sulfurtransferase
VTTDRRRLPAPTEHVEQKTLIDWCELHRHRYPDLAWVYAIPNGGKRHKAVAGKLKAEGVRRGYPDIGLDVARGGFFGLRIELKRQVGGRVTETQAAWITRLRQQGYFADVAEGWERASELLRWYVALPATPRVAA